MHTPAEPLLTWQQFVNIIIKDHYVRRDHIDCHCRQENHDFHGHYQNPYPLHLDPQLQPHFYLQVGPARQASCPHPDGSEAQQSCVLIKVPNLDILDLSHRLSRPSPNHGVEWLHWLSWHRTGHSRNSWKIHLLNLITIPTKSIFQKTKHRCPDAQEV